MLNGRHRAASIWYAARPKAGAASYFERPRCVPGGALDGVGADMVSCAEIHLDRASFSCPNGKERKEHENAEDEDKEVRRQAHEALEDR